VSEEQPAGKPKAREQKRMLTRRRLLLGAGAVGAAGALSRNWGSLSTMQVYQPLLDLGDRAGMRIQRLFMGGPRLAPVYRADQISRDFPSQGGFGASWTDPNPEYYRMVAERFRTWRLQMDGLVRRPLSLSLSELQLMPSRTQITLHSCDQGWSAIGEWTGVPLGWLLDYAQLMPRARYVVLYAMDAEGGVGFFDSIDLFDAFHPQTILAYRFNGEALPVRHGAPLRLRVEMHIGYKNTKHIRRISLVDSLARIGDGRGGLNESEGYQWYAGQ
jgi:DMSO/TMAO reductase YedYZ molybdopterin-dependent catalytic subunit